MCQSTKCLVFVVPLAMFTILMAVSINCYLDFSTHISGYLGKIFEMPPDLSTASEVSLKTWQFPRHTHTATPGATNLVAMDTLSAGNAEFGWALLIFQAGGISGEIFRFLQKLGGASVRCTHSKLDIQSVENLEMCFYHIFCKDSVQN